MPTYDYVCDACGHEFEHFQSMTSAHLRKCPVCKKSKLRRLIGSGAGVIFKGGGFYETDYKKGRTSKGGGSADDAGAPAKSDDSSKSDAKPADTKATPSPDAKPAGDTASKAAGAKDASAKKPDGGAKRGGDKPGGKPSK